MAVDSGEGGDGNLRRLGGGFNRQVDAEALEGINEFVALERFRKAGGAAEAVAEVYCLAVGKCSEHYNGQVF